MRKRRRRGRDGVYERTWRVTGPTGHKVKHVAYGYSIQVPCNPCPHRHKATGAVLHPEGVRQVREFNAAWTREDAEKARAARLLGIAPTTEPAVVAGHTFKAAADRYLATKEGE